MEIDTSSSSNDTVIMPLNGVEEPSDSEIENILKKYSSTSTTSTSNLYSTEKPIEEFTDTSLHKNLRGDYGESDVPLLKRVKKDEDNIETSTKETSQSKYCLEDYLDDSDDNIEKVLGNKNMSTEYLDMNSEEMFRELDNEYPPSTSKGHCQETDLVVLSDDSNTNEPYHDGFSRRVNTLTRNVIEGFTENRKSKKRRTKRRKRNSSADDAGTESDELSPRATAKSKRQRELEKKKRDTAREKERKKEEAEKKRALKNMEKEKKKEEAERQKAMKNALKTVEQSTKPDECIKHMTVELAPEISQKDYSELLKATLQSSNISVRTMPQALPNLVSWCRKVQSIENMDLKNTEVNEKHFLLIMDKSDFLQKIRKNLLKDHIETIWNLTSFKMLAIAVLGQSKLTADQDLAVTEIQLWFKCYFRYLQKNDDLVSLVMEMTKAIAQIPHKAKKEEKYKLQTEYFNDSNKDTVRVDKNGNGLGRLWQQMLTMFPLARLETAEAITAVYPTPDSLFKAYDGCQWKKEEMLQDLPIRRALGPCTSVRRIGPELSRKCSNFFCSADNVLI